MAAIVEARNLVKRYGPFVAVAGIDFTIQAGESFGFLGPNGAGKTSTLKMLACVSPVTSGTLRVLGKEVDQAPRFIKARLGVVPQRENLDPDLTVWQNLLVYARYFDLPIPLTTQRAKEALDLFQLADRKDRPIATLSDGLKRRLLLARALLQQPLLLILDEPTTGLDPQARLLVWQKLRYLQSRGTTLILSTHNMEEAAHLCDRLVIMHQGKILAEGTPAELVQSHVGREVMELHLPLGEGSSALEKLDGYGQEALVVGDTLYFFGQDRDGLRPLQEPARKVVRRQATLEDVFLRLTGRGLGE